MKSLGSKVTIILIASLLVIGLSSMSILVESGVDSFDSENILVNDDSARPIESHDEAETNNAPSVDNANILYGTELGTPYYSEWEHIDLGMEQRYEMGQDAIPFFWLTADGSDPDGDSITYHWEIITKPVGSVAVLDDSWVPWRLYPDVPGYYLVSVVVFDGMLWSEPDYVSMHVYDTDFVTQHDGRIDAYDTDNNGQDDVWVTPENFADVSTSVEISTTGPAPVSGFHPNGIYYHITATEGYELAKVCIKYDDSTITLEEEIQLRLYLYEEIALDVWGWVDVTIESVDWVHNIIAGESPSLSWFVIGNVNNAPFVQSPMPDMEVYEDDSIWIPVPERTIVDIDSGDTLTFSAVTPSWLHFDSGAVLFSGGALQEDVGVYIIELTATDSLGLSVTDYFEIAVLPVNDPPHFDIPLPDLDAYEDQLFLFEIPEGTIVDEDSDITLGTYAILPDWLTFNPVTMTFQGIPAYDDIGVHLIEVIMNDGEFSASDSFEITVWNVISAPVVVNPIPDQEGVVDQMFTYHLPSDTFFDNDVGDTFSISVTTPTWLIYDPDSQIFYGTPTSDDVGPHFIEVTATDSHGLSVSDTFEINLRAVNHAPVALGIHDYATFRGDTLHIDIAGAFDDADDDVLTYSWTGPSFLTFDSVTLMFTATPTEFDHGIYTIELTATDPFRASATDTFDITVNYAPVGGDIPDYVIFMGDTVYINIAGAFTDADGDGLTYSFIGPDFLTFDSVTLMFTATPSENDYGVHTIELTATDSLGASVTDTFDITVVPVNNFPPIVVNPIPDQETSQGIHFSFVIPAETFYDPDENDIHFYSAVTPEWLNFNPVTQTLSGTPYNEHVGVHTIEVTMTDIGGAYATTSFEITVLNVNDAPVLIIPLDDQTINENQPWIYQPPADTFIDIDPDDFLIYIIDAPDWVEFGLTTLMFGGIPDGGDLGPHTITVTAIDSHGASATDIFEITVLNVNDIPYIAHSIPNQEAIEATLFVYPFPADTFDDIDIGDVLTYTADYPSWLVFVPATRTFSGTPETLDYGVHTIEVTATDLAGAYVTATFEITVESIDSDSDGLSNYEEYLLGTDPNLVDTDGDEIWDAIEIDYGSNPLIPQDAWTDQGSDITVVGPSTGIEITYSHVDNEGITTITTSDTAPDLPTGFRLGDTYYSISTSADYSGTINITIPYDGINFNNKNKVRLMHYDEIEGRWVSVTTWVDPVNKIIHGTITSFSLFAVMEMDRIYIDDESDFEALGFPGSGIESDPYIIEGFTLSGDTSDLIHIQDTFSWCIVRDCLVDGLHGDYWATIYVRNAQNVKIENCDVANSKYGIRLSSCSYVTISDNHFVDCKYGISVYSGDHNIVTMNLVEYSEIGIMLEDTDYNTVSENTALNCLTGIGSWSGIANQFTENIVDFVDSPLPYNQIFCIYLSSCSMGSVSDNQVFVNVDRSSTVFIAGFYIQWTSDFTVERNSVDISLNTFGETHCSVYGFECLQFTDSILRMNTVTLDLHGPFGYLIGILLEESHANNVLMNGVHISNDGSILDFESFGLRVLQSTNNVLSGNTISAQAVGRTFGIHLSSSHDCECMFNTVTHHELGIGAIISDRNYFYQNWIENNDRGLELAGDSEENIIEGNTFLNNYYCLGFIDSVSDNFAFSNNFTSDASRLFLVPETTIISNHLFLLEAQLGNYWSDYLGFDLNGDGIGDTDLPWPVPYADEFPIVYDHDSDGLTDTQEILLYGTDPLDSDTDADSWSDYEEVLILFTDPLTPNTPQEVTEVLESKLQGLVDSGVLEQKDVNPLLRKLDAAIFLMDKGKLFQASQKLNDFIDQINAQITSGRLTEEEGNELITLAQSIIDVLLTM